jgi:uncharacterized OB-fold protein
MNNTTATSKSYTIGNQPVQYGWKCPSCGAVMAPWQSSCINCFGMQQITVTTKPSWSWDTSQNVYNTTTTAKSDSTLTACNNTPQTELKNTVKIMKL